MKKNEFRGIIEPGTVYVMWFEGLPKSGAYIGATTRDPENRWKEHCAAIRLKKHTSWQINSLVKCYGLEKVMASIRFGVLVDETECFDCWGEERRIYEQFRAEGITLLNGEMPRGRCPGQYGY